MTYKRLTDVLAHCWDKPWKYLSAAQRDAWLLAFGYRGPVENVPIEIGESISRIQVRPVYQRWAAPTWVWDDWHFSTRMSLAEQHDLQSDPAKRGDKEGHAYMQLGFFRAVARDFGTVDWDSWLSLKSWTRRDTACLLTELDPDDYDKAKSDNNPQPVGLVRRITEIERRAGREQKAGLLGEHPSPMEWTVWAKTSGYALPEELRAYSIPSDEATDTPKVGAGATAAIASPCAELQALPNLYARELSIEFAAGESGGVVLNVSARNVKKRLALSELDLFDHRKGEMNIKGNVMLRWAMGERVTADSRKGMTKQIERLRKELKLRLGIIDDPITQKGGTGYEPVFKIADKRGAADKRAKREAEGRKVSIEKLQERGVQLGNGGQTDYSYETDEEMAGDAADEFLKAHRG